jgi:hypothetical protein
MRINVNLWASCCIFAKKIKMKKLILAVFVSLATCSFGQQYSTAIGLKGGYNFNGGASLNLKHFLGGSSAVEASLGGGSHHLWLQGLYEKNSALSDGFEWYWGIGGDLGFWTNGYSYYSKKNDHYYSGVWGGLDGVLGIEYTFKEFPLNLALDMGPTVRLFPYVGFGWSGGFAARFAIQ